MSGSTVSSLLALVALPAVAFAADPLSQKGPPAAPPLIYSWNGVYLGSQFGYSFNEVSEQATDMTPGYLGASGVFPSLANPVFDAQSYLSKGLFTGVHVGYNKQYGSLVVGTEVDVDFAGMHRAGTQFNMLALGLGGPYGVNIQDNFRLSLRGRVGYAQDRSLYYLTGGLTNGGYTVQQNYWPLSAPTALTRDIFNIERFGWTLGGGVEYAFAGPWSARLEYRHSDFGAAVLASTAIPGLTFRERAAENSVSLGLTYHTEAARAETVAAPQPGTSAGASKPVFPLSSSLGGESSFMGRLVGAYEEEWGLASGPSDPNAPPSRRPEFPPAPVTQPPYPFTEWAFGGANAVGATVPNSVDSPLMKALSPTPAGKFLEENHVQIYGWINPGFNLSTARTQPGALLGGNWPAGYYIYPNQIQLDQVVAVVERLPDTVQKDHFDWGFRITPIYGEAYRYITSFGFFSKQLTKWNLFAGYDMPMIYGELYLPWLAEGVVIRAGRFITLPDIEAQLAPNNYM